MIVLTGGAGFIGSCILAQLNKLGHADIWVVDHLEDASKKENLKKKKFAQYVDKEEFLQKVLKGQLPKGITSVIHMGACSSTMLTDAQYYQKNNFEYTRILADWALEHRVRFIYASSAATYGDGSCGYKDDTATIRRCRPLNLYGESKQKFDLWVLDHKLEDKVAGLRFFNVFGPNEYHKGDMRSVIAKAYDRVAKEGKISLFKSYKKEYEHGEQKRDFIYIKDAVDITLFFFHNAKMNGIYNVGTGKARAWNDVAKAMFKAINKPVNIEYIEMPGNLKDQYQYFTEAGMSKLRKSGYTKKFTELEDAVGDYTGYLKKHAYI